MAKEFNYMKRSPELIAQGVPDEETVRILDKEAAEAEIAILDDGAWLDMLKDIEDEVIRGYEESLKQEQEF